MIRYIGTDPRKSVLMPRAISLRSRVLGNWQARFWRPVERGDPSAEFNQAQGDHFTGPEVRLGVFEQHLDNLRRKDSLREAETIDISVRLENYSASHFEPTFKGVWYAAV